MKGLTIILSVCDKVFPTHISDISVLTNQYEGNKKGFPRQLEVCKKLFGIKCLYDAYKCYSEMCKTEDAPAPIRKDDPCFLPKRWSPLQKHRDT